MMESNDVLIKILEELKIDGNEFQTQIVTGEFIQSGIFLIFNAILLIMAIKFFMSINQELYVKENIIQIFSLLKNYKNADDEYKKKQQLETNKETSKNEESSEDILKDFYDIVMKWVNKAQINRIIITFVLIYFELKIFFMFANNVIKHVIIMANCYAAPEKIVLDYLTDLF